MVFNSNGFQTFLAGGALLLPSNNGELTLTFKKRKVKKRLSRNSNSSLQDALTKALFVVLGIELVSL